MVTRARGLRGRDTELATIEALLDAATAQRPFVCVVEGEAGIGKSRLTEEVQSRADGAFGVSYGRGYELEQQRAFGPLIDALDLRPGSPDEAAAAIGSLIRSAGAAAATQPTSIVHEVVDAIVDLLDARSASEPIVVVVDDLQWADTATLLALARLARAREHIDASLLLALRPTPRGSHLRALLALLHDHGATHLRLEGLAPDAIAELAADTVGLRPGDNLQRRLEGAAGNPLYALEVLAALREEGAITERDGAGEVEGTELPPSLSITILRRLGFLPSETIDALRHAAVLGSGFEVPDLAAVMHTSAAELTALLRPALDADVIRADDTRLRFRHDLIWEAVHNDIPAPARAALHTDAARALAAVDAPPLKVATQFALGTTDPNAEAAEWLWRAALSLMAFDPATGTEMARRSLERTPPEHPLFFGRRVWLARVRADLEPTDDSEAELLALREAAVEITDRWAIDATLVSLLIGQNRFDEAERLALAEPRPRAVQVVLAASLGVVRSLQGDLTRAAALVEQLEHAVVDPDATASYNQRWMLTDEIAETASRAFTSGTHAALAWMSGASDEAAQRSREAMQLFVMLEEHLPPQATHAEAVLALVDAGHRDWRDITARVARAPRHSVPEVEAAAALGYWLAGEWDDAVVQAEVSVERGDAIGVEWLGNLAACVAGFVAWDRGDAAAADRWLARAESALPFLDCSGWLRAVIAEDAGRAEEAAGIVEKMWRVDRARDVRALIRHYAPDAVRIAADAGRRSLAEEMCAAVDALSDTGQTVVARAVARRCRGILVDDPQLLVDASAAYASVDWVPLVARCREDAAVAFARTGDLTAARASLTAALAAYDELGATSSRARALRRARDVGITTRAKAATSRPVTGWDSLTAAERAVVELVAEGHTYRDVAERLYVSRRTVETHVAHVFTKIGVSSKAELIGSYLRR